MVVEFSRVFKYKRGDRVVLHGLIDNPKFNGTRTVVMGLRAVVPNPQCPSGCAYYLDNLEMPNDWYYEERLCLV